MKTATFWLVLLAALPCAAGGKKIADKWNVNRRHGCPSSQKAGFSIVWADATPSGLRAIWGSSIVWADVFAGEDERTSVLGGKQPHSCSLAYAPIRK